MSELKTGMRVEGVYSGHRLTDAKLYISPYGVYILSNDNDLDGATAPDLLGYKYSWQIGASPTFSSLERMGLRVVTEFKPGDVVLAYEEERLVIGYNHSGDLVTEDSYDKSYDLIAWDERDIKNANLRLKNSDDVRELTLAEIAKKFDVPVESIRIKEEK